MGGGVGVDWKKHGNKKEHGNKDGQGRGKTASPLQGEEHKSQGKKRAGGYKIVLARRFAYSPPQIFKQEGFIFWGAVGYSVRSHTAIFAGPRFCQSAYGMAVKGTCLRRRSWVK